MVLDYCCVNILDFVSCLDEATKEVFCDKKKLHKTEVELVVWGSLCWLTSREQAASCRCPINGEQNRWAAPLEATQETALIISPASQGSIVYCNHLLKVSHIKFVPARAYFEQ